MGNNDIAIFNGVGFHTWQVKLKGYLMRKGLWSIITTAEPQNQTAPQQRERQLKDEKALGILLTSVADDIIHHLDQAKTAKEAWDTLERTFGAKSKHSKISLKMQLYGLMMHENESLSSLVNRLKSICTQLSYIACNIDEDDKIAVLLKSLPMSYDNIVLVLKEKEPIPSLEDIVHSLQEENNKHTHLEVATNQALFISNSKQQKACKHCGKYNHASKDCYKINKCSKCGIIGHPPQFCKRTGGGNEGNNAKQAYNTRGYGGKGGGKGQRVHYTHSDSDNEDDGHDEEDHDDGINYISSATISSPSSSSSKLSNKNAKGKHVYCSSEDDDIL